jgi:hypothetical protein
MPPQSHLHFHLALFADDEIGLFPDPLPAVPDIPDNATAR